MPNENTFPKFPDHFPADVLFQIVSYLSVTDHNNVKRVCKRFNTVLDDSVYIKQFSLLWLPQHKEEIKEQFLRLKGNSEFAKRLLINEDDLNSGLYVETVIKEYKPEKNSALIPRNPASYFFQVKNTQQNLISKSKNIFLNSNTYVYLFVGVSFYFISLLLYFVCANAECLEPIHKGDIYLVGILTASIPIFFGVTIYRLYKERQLRILQENTDRLDENSPLLKKESDGAFENAEGNSNNFNV